MEGVKQGLGDVSQERPCVWKMLLLLGRESEIQGQLRRGKPEWDKVRCTHLDE